MFVISKMQMLQHEKDYILYQKLVIKSSLAVLFSDLVKPSIKIFKNIYEPFCVSY